ncbi:hypothetical protein [Legionella cardiaca]|uniref:Periplasmic copper-binding protein NosD beta helix domain-containing protein n=1 Tax=Legionella cardiaca TaxID=1071983 RepID=A0ABY8ARG9_9GAMM|nr:hypothetical protein [Legionella cardiaca]WED43277.1 hypothetical protein PXX05_00435 [Legionella cardiaca]
MFLNCNQQSAINPILALFLSLSCNITAFALPANCHSLENNIISSPGCYYLNENIKGSIAINSDSVVLDLNEKKLSDPNPGSQNIGIGLSNHSNITVKNGYLDGFWFAISGSGGRNLNVLNISFTNTKYIAVNLSGAKINVSRNFIGNMDFYQPKDKVNYYLVGLNIRDTSGCRILNNVISAPSLPTKELEYRLEYVGLILLSESQNCRIQNNIFSNFQSPLFKSIAVWLASGTSNNFLGDNLILNYLYGITGRLDSYSENNNLPINVEKPKLNKALETPSYLNHEGAL